MRVFETHVQELKNDVLRSVAKLAWADDLQTGILDIPEQLIPGPEAKMRCCKMCIRDSTGITRTGATGSRAFWAQMAPWVEEKVIRP